MRLFDKHYTPRGEVDKTTLKKKVFEYCCLEEYEGKEHKGIYQDEDIDPVCLTEWEAFKQVDFDLDRFFLEDCYWLIDDEISRHHIMVECLGMVEPISQYVFKWMDCYLDFGTIKNETLTCGKDHHPIGDDDIFKYLYFCRTEEEIWDLLASGIGDIEKLFLYYMGIDPFPTYTVICNSQFLGIKDEAKAKHLIDYILTDSCYTTNEVRNKILYRMDCDSMEMYMTSKDIYVDRYREEAVAKTINSLLREGHSLLFCKDPSQKELAIKYFQQADKMKQEKDLL